MTAFLILTGDKMSTNVTEFIQDLDVGNFKEKFGAVLSEVAIGVMRSETGAAKGKVTAEFEITMLSSEKVNVKSKLKFVKPTSRGILSEEDTTETPMYISRSGELSIMQKKSLFDKDTTNIIDVN